MVSRGDFEASSVCVGGVCAGVRVGDLGAATGSIGLSRKCECDRGNCGDRPKEGRIAAASTGYGKRAPRGNASFVLRTWRRQLQDGWQFDSGGQQIVLGVTYRM